MCIHHPIEVIALGASLQQLWGPGGVHGDPNAPDEVLEAFEIPVMNWMVDTHNQRKPCFTRCILLGELRHDASLYRFIDDLL